MGRATLLLATLLTAACASEPQTVRYQGASDAERTVLAASRKDVYPNDVRPEPERFKRATLAWAGIVTEVMAEAERSAFVELTIAHHYWDWMEDHSTPKAKAFLSPRGEGMFVCHAERTSVMDADVRGALVIAYVRPLVMKDGLLHAACIVRLYPRDTYATDVLDYGRGGSDLKVLRVPTP
jgi:hypothetical protein